MKSKESVFSSSKKNITAVKKRVEKLSGDKFDKFARRFAIGLVSGVTGVELTEEDLSWVNKNNLNVQWLPEAMKNEDDGVEAILSKLGSQMKDLSGGQQDKIKETLEAVKKLTSKGEEEMCALVDCTTGVEEEADAWFKVGKYLKTSANYEYSGRALGKIVKMLVDKGECGKTKVDDDDENKKSQCEKVENFIKGSSTVCYDYSQSAALYKEVMDKDGSKLKFKRCVDPEEFDAGISSLYEESHTRRVINLKQLFISILPSYHSCHKFAPADSNFFLVSEHMVVNTWVIVVGTSDFFTLS